MTYYEIAQLLIALIGVPAVLCSQMPSQRWKRWAPILGLLGQPAWFYFAWTAKGAEGESSMGAFIMCFLYTAAWSVGLWHYWIKPIREAIALHRIQQAFIRASRKRTE